MKDHGLCRELSSGGLWDRFTSLGVLLRLSRSIPMFRGWGMGGCMIVMLEVSFKRLVVGLAVRPGGSGKIHIPAAGCLLHLDVLRRKKVVSL